MYPPYKEKAVMVQKIFGKSDISKKKKTCGHGVPAYRTTIERRAAAYESIKTKNEAKQSKAKQSKGNFRLGRSHCVRFLLFKPLLIRQTYTERRRLAPEYMRSNTHTNQRTQQTIVTNIMEREFVATPILSYIYIYIYVHIIYYISCPSVPVARLGIQVQALPSSKRHGTQ